MDQTEPSILTQAELQGHLEKVAQSMDWLEFNTPLLNEPILQILEQSESPLTPEEITDQLIQQGLVPSLFSKTDRLCEGVAHALGGLFLRVVSVERSDGQTGYLMAPGP